jgi:hypothetical protein
MPEPRQTRHGDKARRIQTVGKVEFLPEYGEDAVDLEKDDKSN